MPGYDYFCGANVVIRLQGFPLFEAVGISYDIAESKRPLYGYASRHFDAVASGQVIVQGELLINYIHQDYLYQALMTALGQETTEEPEPSPVPIPLDDIEGYTELMAQQELSQEAQTQQENAIWGSTEGAPDTLEYYVSRRNLHDIRGGFDIKIIFGAQDGSRPNGKTGILLSGVHFMGRGKQIQIDEQVCVERYSFFARNVYSLRNVSKVTTSSSVSSTAPAEPVSPVTPSSLTSSALTGDPTEEVYVGSGDTRDSAPYEYTPDIARSNPELSGDGLYDENSFSEFFVPYQGH